MNETDHLVKLTSVPRVEQAAIIVAALAEHGVRAVQVGGFTAGFVAEAPGWVQVKVAEEDLPRAQQLFDELDIDHAGDEIDWNQVDVGEPEDA